MGLFSTKKTNTTQSTTNNNSTSLGIDGDLSGILGDGNAVLTDSSTTDNSQRTDIYQDLSEYTEIFTDNSQVTDIYQDLSDNSDRSQRTDIYQDLSDNSVTDIYQDSSNRSVTDIYQDSSNRSVTDIYQDLSDNSNREFQGTLSGANAGGNITYNNLSDGAFDFGSDVVKELSSTAQAAIKGATEQTYLATQATAKAAQDALSFGESAMKSVENTSNSALDKLYKGSETAINAVTDASILQGEKLGEYAELFANSNKAATQASIENANKAMERNAALIQTTALGGQDLMIDAMKKVLIGAAALVGISVLAVSFRGAK